MSSTSVRVALGSLTVWAGLAIVAPSDSAAQARTCQKEPCPRQDLTATEGLAGSLRVGRGARGLPARFSGVSGGPADAPTDRPPRGEACVGHTGVLPDHVLHLADAVADLSLRVQGRGDTTLLVHGPGGWRCNDDAHGVDPALRGRFEAGTWRIWVGSFDPLAYHDYVLEVAEGGPLGERDDAPLGATGAFDVSGGTALERRIAIHRRDLVQGVTMSARTQGAADASVLGRTPTGTCAGRTTETPSWILDVSGQRQDVYLSLEHSGVLGVALHGPEGWRCVPPSEAGEWVVAMQAGTYRVWVTEEEPERGRGGRDGRGDRRGRMEGRDATSYELALSTDRRARRAEPRVEPVRSMIPYRVRGRFEDIDVHFEGGSVDEVHAECSRFVASARNLSMVDDIVVHGTAWRNRSSYWSGGALCAIVALNARPDGVGPEMALVRGTVEETPFEVYGSTDTVRSVLLRYLPLAVDMAWADDLVVNGHTRRNRSSYWSVDEAVMIILSLAQ